LIHWHLPLTNAFRHADDTTNLTWGGQTYETDDGKVRGSVETEQVNLSQGFDIQDTEIVLVSFVH